MDISEESLYMETVNMMQNVINQKIGNSDYITKKTYNNFMSSMILFKLKLVKSPSDNKKDRVTAKNKEEKTVEDISHSDTLVLNLMRLMAILVNSNSS